MRKWGRLGLELVFVALLYTAVGIVLGVFSAGWGRPLDLLLLLFQNLLAVIPLAFFIWKVEGTWWSVGGTCALALPLLQAVVPRMEAMLERGQSLIQVPTLAPYALGAGAAAAAALLLVLRSWQVEDDAPPYPWPAGEPATYMWRIPGLVAAFAVLHMLAARLGRIVVGQTAHPPLLGELVAKLYLGGLVALAALAICAHLGVRSRRRLLILLAVLAVIPAIGRWQILTGWPATFIATRVGVRSIADLVVGACAAWALLGSLSGLSRSLERGQGPDGSSSVDEEHSEPTETLSNDLVSRDTQIPAVRGHPDSRTMSPRGCRLTGSFVGLVFSFLVVCRPGGHGGEARRA